ncbi:FixH family protein [Aquimarina hainanensis]|uniref:FixH family protein n=1 Tax=Aquimarina hainanensis TaxID=1578017 RepID=A0ABW5N3B2_9FLAO|nr:FixH family protein [Aquimarina sp. TRL1]QKX04394.1 FixH family protein [Aquimarina sp. TRL1]
MKINWGTSIVLVFIGFISFIMFFVIKMNTQEKYNHHLVTEDYYKKELAFQKEIDAAKNTSLLKNSLNVRQVDDQLIIYFPEDLDPAKISGTITLYRPSNENLDFEIPIQLEGSKVEIPQERLVAGRWNINISWNYQGVPYLFKKPITL